MAANFSENKIKFQAECQVVAARLVKLAVRQAHNWLVKNFKFGVQTVPTSQPFVRIIAPEIKRNQPFDLDFKFFRKTGF